MNLVLEATYRQQTLLNHWRQAASDRYSAEVRVLSLCAIPNELRDPAVDSELEMCRRIVAVKNHQLAALEDELDVLASEMERSGASADASEPTEPKAKPTKRTNLRAAPPA